MLLARLITIGPVVPDDFPAMFCWANDVNAARFDVAYRPIDFVAHSQWCENLGKDQSMVVFAIRKLNTTAIIGYVRVFNINSVHRSADLGIRIGQEADRGQGYGREAVGLALEFCWKHLNRVQLIVFRHNERATRAYAAAGFKKEGQLRKAAFIDGAWVDLVVMGALRPAQMKRGMTVAPIAPAVMSAAAA